MGLDANGIESRHFEGTPGSWDALSSDLVDLISMPDFGTGAPSFSGA